jgi:hypothetical protein
VLDYIPTYTFILVVVYKYIGNVLLEYKGLSLRIDKSVLTRKIIPHVWLLLEGHALSLISVP